MSFVNTTYRLGVLSCLYKGNVFVLAGAVVGGFAYMRSVNSLGSTLTRSFRVGGSQFGCMRLKHGGALLVVFFGSDLHAHLDARGTTLGLNVGMVMLSVGRKT